MCFSVVTVCPYSVVFRMRISLISKYTNPCTLRQELFADIYPLNSDLWSLNQQSQSLYFQDEKEWTMDNMSQFERELEGLAAFLLAVKKRPLIRWQKGSHLGNKLANRLQDLIATEKELFGWSEPDIKPLLLLCDRREDPITPLLSQWTYQAMVHELIGIENSRCMLPTDKKGEVVLNPFNDDFFRNNKSVTFGDLGANIKKLVNQFAKKAKGSKSLQSIVEMQKFVENYGDYLAKQGNVTKHVAVMGELSAIVADRKLLDVSAVEQEIVCGNDHKKHFNEVERMIKNPAVKCYDKLRLALIYAIRYQSKGKEKASELRYCVVVCCSLEIGFDSVFLALNLFESLHRTLLRNNVVDDEVLKDIPVLDIMLRHFGSNQRKMNLFEEEKQNGNLIGKLGSIVKSINGMDEVQNIYTQHNPLLHHIIEDAVKCKLDYSQWSSFQGGHKQQLRQLIVTVYCFWLYCYLIIVLWNEQTAIHYRLLHWRSDI